MKDTVAEMVADRMDDLVTTLEAMGLRRASILRGYEIATERLRKRVKGDKQD